MSRLVAITPDQLNLLRHTIGLDRYPKIRCGTYKAYRNYFAQGQNEHRAFESLCKKKICEKHINSKDYIYYHVTPLGAEIIGLYCGLKIKLED